MGKGYDHYDHRKEQEKMNRPPRKQDEYVSGYRNGGEGNSGSGNGNKQDESCGGEAAKMVIVGATLVALAVKAVKLKRRK